MKQIVKTIVVAYIITILPPAAKAGKAEVEIPDDLKDVDFEKHPFVPIPAISPGGGDSEARHGASAENWIHLLIASKMDTRMHVAWIK